MRPSVCLSVRPSVRPSVRLSVCYDDNSSIVYARQIKLSGIVHWDKSKAKFEDELSGNILRGTFDGSKVATPLHACAVLRCGQQF